MSPLMMIEKRMQDARKKQYKTLRRLCVVGGPERAAYMFIHKYGPNAELLTRP